MSMQQTGQGRYQDILHTFLNGEVSVDSFGNDNQFSRYSSLKTSENVNITDAGAITVRPGAKYLTHNNYGECTFSYCSSDGQLWMLYFNNSQPKVVIVNDVHGEFFVKEYTVVVPTSLDKAFEISYVYSEHDKLYICANDVFLVKLSNDSIVISPVTGFSTSQITPAISFSEKNKTIRFNTNREISTNPGSDFFQLEVYDFNNYFVNINGFLINRSPSEIFNFVTQNVISKYNSDQYSYFSSSDIKDINLTTSEYVYDEDNNKWYKGGTLKIDRLSWESGNIRLIQSTSLEYGGVGSDRYHSLVRESGKFSNGTTINVNGCLFSLYGIDTSSLTLDATISKKLYPSRAIISFQRLIALVGDILVYSNLNNYADFGFSASTGEYANSIKNVGIGEANAICAIKDGVVFAKRDGLRFFKLDLVNNTIFPFLSFISSTTCISDGLLAYFGYLFIANQYGIYKFRVDNIVSNDVAIEKGYSYTDIEDVSLLNKHIFFEGVDRVHCSSFRSNIVIKMILKNGDIYNLVLRRSPYDNSFVLSATKHRYMTRQIDFSNGDNYCVFTTNPQTYNMVGIHLDDLPVNIEATYNKNKYYSESKIHYLDFYKLYNPKIVIRGYINKLADDIMDRKLQFHINEPNTIPIFANVGGAFVVYNVCTRETFRIRIDNIDQTVVNTYILVPLNPEIQLREYTDREIWLLIGELSKTELTDIQPYTEYGTDYSIAYSDGVMEHCVPSTKLIKEKVTKDNEGNSSIFKYLDIDSLSEGLYFCVGFNYNSSFELFNENYSLKSKLQYVYTYSYLSKGYTITSRYGYIQNKTHIVTSVDFYNCTYTDIQLNRLTECNTPTIGYIFKNGFGGVITKVVMIYNIEG